MIPASLVRLVSDVFINNIAEWYQLIITQPSINHNRAEKGFGMIEFEYTSMDAVFSHVICSDSIKIIIYINCSGT